MSASIFVSVVSLGEGRNLRWPSALALFFAAFRIMRMSSRMVTIKEPNAIEPSESVDARTKDESVGCFG